MTYLLNLTAIFPDRNFAKLNPKPLVTFNVGEFH